MDYRDGARIVRGHALPAAAARAQGACRFVEAAMVTRPSLLLIVALLLAAALLLLFEWWSWNRRLTV